MEIGRFWREFEAVLDCDRDSRGLGSEMGLQKALNRTQRSSKTLGRRQKLILNN